MADRVGQLLGNYRLLRILGRGSFAEVYLGEHLYLERPAAIKVLHVQMDPKTQEQFRREARTIGHLHHPHIVQVLDFGIHDRTPYLVMEYTPGGTLRSHHPKGTRLSLEQIVTSVKQIASALDYAHQQRVIHRDIKPDNLLLNAKDEIVLSDFGLAVVQRTLDSLSTQNPAGTPLYMAPEQIQRKACAASDQYALGIMVYEWLTGEPPFHGALFEVFSQHLYQPPPSLRERLPDLPLAVEEAVFKALAKDPEHRFAWVADFASALERACDATQPLTLPGLAKQRTQEPIVSYRTLFVPPATAREPEDSSSSMQPVPTTVPRTQHGEEVVPAIAPGPLRHGLTVSKQVKPSVSQSNRQRFLRRVRAFWIDGVLEHSLHGAALIALGLQEQLDALANPWQLVLQYPNTAPRSFPLGTCITDVYDAANGELLILGAPGSGKTTLLLELARDLLDRAEQDEQHLMPVVFPLSSWAGKQPLTEWMVEELISKYQVPRKLARAWIDAYLILPLLDGLDEVAAGNRTACIETVNTYHQEHGLLPLVVASRSTDYLEQTGRLRLGSAVTIQSLTQQQVDDYLASGGEALWALRVALHQDAVLREMIETPLMLSILTLTYHAVPVEELLREGIAPTRQQIFEHYVERMLVHRGARAPYRAEQTRDWLTWLAKQMKRQNQTVFYIERMQPNWLIGTWIPWLYCGITDALIYGLLSLLGSWLVITQLGWMGKPPESVLVPILPEGLIIGLFGGLTTGLLNCHNTEIKPSEVVSWSWGNMWRYLIVGVIIGLVGGVISSFSSLSWIFTPGLIGELLNPILGFSVGSLVAITLYYTLIYLPVGVLVNMLVNRISPKKQDKHNLIKPNQGMRRSAYHGVLIGLVVGLSAFVIGVPVVVGFSRYPPTIDSPSELFYGLVGGLVVGPILGLLNGFSHEKLDKNNLVKPNQGIRRSA